MIDYAISFADIITDLLPLFAHHSEVRYFPMYSQVSKAWHEVFHKSHSILHIDEYLHSVETLEWAMSSGGRCTKFTCEIPGFRHNYTKQFDEVLQPTVITTSSKPTGRHNKPSMFMELTSGCKKSIALTNLIMRQSPMNVLIHAIENLGFEHDDTTIAAAFTGTDTEKIDYILNLSSIKKNFMLARMAAKYGGRDTVDHIINKYKLRVKPSVIDRILVKYGSYVEGVPISGDYIDLMWAKAIVRDDVQLLEDILSKTNYIPFSDLSKLNNGAIASRAFLSKLIELTTESGDENFRRHGLYMMGKFKSGLARNTDLIPKALKNSAVIHLYLRYSDELIDNEMNSIIKCLCDYQFLTQCIDCNNLVTIIKIMSRISSENFHKIKPRALLSYALEHRRVRISEYLLEFVDY